MLPETSKANTIEIPSEVTLLPLEADRGRANPIMMHVRAANRMNCGNHLNLVRQVAGVFCNVEMSGNGIAVAFLLK